MRRYAVFARLGAGATLIVFWGLVDSPLSGIVFLLALTALSAVRYRFGAYRWLGPAETAVCAAYAFIWPPGLLGLWLPAIGLLESRWRLWEGELLRKGYQDRGERLKLEASREAAARETQSAARLAEMAERSRIAQDIHDHVGHELSGALIALQTALRLYEKNDCRAGALLRQSAARLETASEHLREAVHNLKPAQMPDAGTLEALCREFRLCPVAFAANGDLGGLAHWELLVSSLKEALTNVARHADGVTLVTVKLDGNADYVRMRVGDNGHTKTIPKLGLGLSGMRERARAAGGTLHVSAENGFAVLMVLPKGDKYEAAGR